MTEAKPTIQEREKTPRGKQSTLRHSVFRHQKIKYKDRILKKGRGKKASYLQRNKDNNDQTSLQKPYTKDNWVKHSKY